jgi:hypothetical protein
MSHEKTILDLFADSEGSMDPKDVLVVNQYPGGAPHAGCDTSRAAAESVGGKLSELRQQVYDFISSRGENGATDHEIHLECGLRRYTAAPRRRELFLAGLVEDSGLRRPTDTGSPAKVWIATPPGKIQENVDKLKLENMRNALKKRIGNLSYSECLDLDNYLSRSNLLPLD